MHFLRPIPSSKLHICLDLDLDLREPAPTTTWCFEILNWRLIEQGRMLFQEMPADF